MFLSAVLTTGLSWYRIPFAYDADPSSYAPVPFFLSGLASGFIDPWTLASELLIGGWSCLALLGRGLGVFIFRGDFGPQDNVDFLGKPLSGPCSAALVLLVLVVLLGAVRTVGLVFDDLIGALLAKSEFLAPLAFLGSAYVFILFRGEPWTFGLGGLVGLRGGVRTFVIRVGHFGLFGVGVAGVGRHGEYEDVLEGTAYWPRVRGFLGDGLDYFGSQWLTTAPAGFPSGGGIPSLSRLAHRRVSVAFSFSMVNFIIRSHFVVALRWVFWP